MERVMEIIEREDVKTALENQDSTLTLKTCCKCGDFIEKDIMFLNRLRRVNIICTCKKIEREKREAHRKWEEKRDKINTILKNHHLEGSYKDKTLENWDFKKGDKKNHNLGVKYSKNFKEIKDKGFGLLLTGRVGNGKTYLCFSIANEVAKNNHTVACITINALLERFKETYKNYGDNGEIQILNTLDLVELLIIDDLGVEKNTEWSVSMIYEIIDSRYRKKLPLIITTNLTPEEINNRYGERIGDRISEMCTSIDFKNSSIRKENTEENIKKLKAILN